MYAVDFGDALVIEHATAYNIQTCMNAHNKQVRGRLLKTLRSFVLLCSVRLCHALLRLALFRLALLRLALLL